MGGSKEWVARISTSFPSFSGLGKLPWETSHQKALDPLDWLHRIGHYGHTGRREAPAVTYPQLRTYPNTGSDLDPEQRGPGDWFSSNLN